MNWDRVRTENRTRRYGSEPLWLDGVHPPPAPDTPKAPERRRIDLAKLETGRNGMVRCPICRVDVKRTRVERHINRIHAQIVLDPERKTGGGRLDQALATPDGAHRNPEVKRIRTSSELAADVISKGLLSLFILRKAQELGLKVVSTEAPLPPETIKSIRSYITRPPKTSTKL